MAAKFAWMDWWKGQNCANNAISPNKLPIRNACHYIARSNTHHKASIYKLHRRWFHVRKLYLIRILWNRLQISDGYLEVNNLYENLCYFQRSVPELPSSDTTWSADHCTSNTDWSKFANYISLRKIYFRFQKISYYTSRSMCQPYKFIKFWTVKSPTQWQWCRPFLGLRDFDWAPTFLEMYSKKLDKLSIVNLGFIDFLPIESSEQLRKVYIA